MSDPTAGGTGGEGGNPPSAPPGLPTPPTPPAPTGDEQPKLTQEEVDRILGQRTAEAQRQATRKLVKDQLGFEKLEDLQAFVAEAKKAREAQMSETDRLKAEAEALKAQAQADREAAAAERLSLSVERELTKAGAQGDLALLSRLVVVEPGADQAAVEAAVAQVKNQVPALFGQGTPSLPSTQPVGGGSPQQRTTTSNLNPLEVGAAKAEAYEKNHQRSGF